MGCLIFHVDLLLSTIVFIGVSLNEPHHVRSTVKFVFLLVALFVCLSPPYMVEGNQKYIESH